MENKTISNVNQFMIHFLFSFFICSLSFTLAQLCSKNNATFKKKIRYYISVFQSIDTFFNPEFESDEEDNKESLAVKKEPEVLPKKPQKYEDKYIEAVRAQSKEYTFTEEEEMEMKSLFETGFQTTQHAYHESRKDLQSKIDKPKNDMPSIKKMTDTEFRETFDTEQPNMSKEEYISHIHLQWKKWEEEMADLETKLNNPEMIREEAFTVARNKVIDKKIDKLKGCFIMEMTPLGNVLMTYNKERSTFSYYSDNTIPYRYLEVVCRKFVKSFHCRPLFVDMEEELKARELQLEEEKQKEKEKESMANNVNDNDSKNKDEKKKNVFAKLKNYNQSSGKVGVGQSNIPYPTKTNQSTNDKLVLKENANRYTYEGKISTFNMLKKPDRKIIDKKYALSFADFKKLQLAKK
jgi:hypothetical protein